MSNVEKWIEAGALALIRVDHESACEVNDVATQVANAAREDALIAIRAFLAAAEEDGLVITRMPDAWTSLETDDEGLAYEEGFNDALFAVLAGKETVL